MGAGDTVEFEGRRLERSECFEKACQQFPKHFSVTEEQEQGPFLPAPQRDEGKSRRCEPAVTAVLAAIPAARLWRAEGCVQQAARCGHPTLVNSEMQSTFLAAPQRGGGKTTRRAPAVSAILLAVPPPVAAALPSASDVTDASTQTVTSTSGSSVEDLTVEPSTGGSTPQASFIGDATTSPVEAATPAFAVGCTATPPAVLGARMPAMSVEDSEGSGGGVSDGMGWRPLEDAVGNWTARGPKSPRCHVAAAPGSVPGRPDPQMASDFSPSAGIGRLLGLRSTRQLPAQFSSPQPSQLQDRLQLSHLCRPALQPRWLWLRPLTTWRVSPRWVPHAVAAGLSLLWRPADCPGRRIAMGSPVSQPTEEPPYGVDVPQGKSRGSRGGKNQKWAFPKIHRAALQLDEQERRQLCLLLLLEDDECKRALLRGPAGPGAVNASVPVPGAGGGFGGAAVRAYGPQGLAFGLGVEWAGSSAARRSVSEAVPPTWGSGSQPPRPF
eukprot:NODE_783_length_1783_cov_4.673587_g638_i0.p1 GENE.NODE_783_length_1783_cov_4.673587_g638_i0~~NODE_783_length_1783_cov_4.673587_g638_i0.p1  ORF type:complete len:531 (+),score=32.46 NODE_783_length_1783_cov_4.673587_g638_i0:110-1594(+)